MQIKYFAKYDDTILPLNVVSETTYFYKDPDGRWMKKDNDYGMLFGTFADAKTFLLTRLNTKIKIMENNLLRMKAKRYEVTLLEPLE